MPVTLGALGVVLWKKRRIFIVIIVVLLLILVICETFMDGIDGIFFAVAFNPYSLLKKQFRAHLHIIHCLNVDAIWHSTK